MELEVDDAARLRAHFDRTLVALLRAPPRAAVRVTRRREAMLLALARYRDRGRFPRNDRAARRTPVFVDSLETRCAMAHLVDASGEHALVERIARTRNDAFVRELADDGELVAWLAAHGLSAAEAARIQPTYDPTLPLPDALAFCGGPEASGVARFHIGADDAGAPITVVDITWGMTALRVGSPIAIDPTKLEHGRWLVVVDAAGSPVGKPVLEEDHGIVPIGRPNVAEADAANVGFAPDCRDRITALYPSNDAGASTVAVGAPAAGGNSGGCHAAAHAGGDAIAIALALLALRRARRR